MDNCATYSTLSSLATIQIMKRDSVFVDTIKMDTETIFMENGEVKFFPASYEEDQSIVNGADEVHQRGSLVCTGSGKGHFRPYNTGGPSIYHTLLKTGHGEVKESAHKVYVTLTFLKREGKVLVNKALAEECAEIKAYMKSKIKDARW